MRPNGNEEREKCSRKQRKEMRKVIWVFNLVTVLIPVTKNEYVYESFSEDEDSDATPNAMKAPANPVSSANATGGKKKGKANADGQKSLMSFFGKK